MPNFDELLKGKEAAGLMKDPSKLEKLRDAAQLAGAIRQLMSDPEGAKLIQQMKENFK